MRSRVSCPHIRGSRVARLGLRRPWGAGTPDERRSSLVSDTNMIPPNLKNTNVLKQLLFGQEAARHKIGVSTALQPSALGPDVSAKHGRSLCPAAWWISGGGSRSSNLSEHA